MPIGIANQTAINMSNLISLTNSTRIYEMFINVNNDIYSGWLYFVLLLVTWFILFIAANKVNDQMIQNLMLSGVVVSILSLLLRAVTVVQNGIVRGLLSDFQMWMFPIITVLLAMIVWGSKE